ncbi:hypothetical protein FIBSPDRAFT_187682 [Athelia psychrophila]|uniref:Uncharacterized protein n=1 Tax=Athelia psychrophila TaxID=1759441 RepID=A0A166A8N2_9AGAM|nr:hypothetical protein FIBSPDRAFT_187682 [Fibularhizoctonia sp. CBS 109695]
MFASSPRARKRSQACRATQIARELIEPLTAANSARDPPPTSKEGRRMQVKDALGDGLIWEHVAHKAPRKQKLKIARSRREKSQESGHGRGVQTPKVKFVKEAKARLFSQRGKGKRHRQMQRTRSSVCSCSGDQDK